MLKYIISAFVLLATVGAAHATRYYQSREDGSYFVIPTPSTRSVPVPGRPGTIPPPGCYKEVVESKYYVVVCVIPMDGVWPPGPGWPPTLPKPPGTWPPVPEPPLPEPPLPEPPLPEPPLPEPPLPEPPLPEPPAVKDHIHKPGGPMDLSPPPSVQPVPQASRSSYIPGGKPMIRPFRQQYLSRYAR